MYKPTAKYQVEVGGSCGRVGGRILNSKEDFVIEESGTQQENLQIQLTLAREGSQGLNHRSKSTPRLHIDPIFTGRRRAASRALHVGSRFTEVRADSHSVACIWIP